MKFNGSEKSEETIGLVWPAGQVPGCALIF
jgi:hypothetical protein